MPNGELRGITPYEEFVAGRRTVLVRDATGFQRPERLLRCRLARFSPLPLLELDIHPKLVQYIKLAEAQVGLGSEHVRAPRLTIAGKEREDVLKVINDGIAARPVLNFYF